MNRFTVNADGTVTDTKLGLIWSQKTIAEDVDHDEAKEAVAAFGEGWRLPTRQELESLLDLSRYNPAIDTEVFPDTKSDDYWTDTPTAWNTAAVWVVIFGYGAVGDGGRGNLACVRAVRSAPAGQ